MQRELTSIQAKTVIGIRQLLHAIPSANVDDLRVAVARSREELDAAHGLVHRRYRWRGYAIDRPTGDLQRRDADA